jgi:RND superfamily putative drug exporter
MTGIAQINRDACEAITSRLPIVLAVIAAITFVLLFLLTGSVVLPLKALLLNVLSLRHLRCSECGSWWSPFC